MTEEQQVTQTPKKTRKKRTVKPKQSDNNNISQTLTSEEKAIRDRVLGEGKDYRDIRIEEINDFSLMEDPFKLPPEAQKLQDQKKFAFRWADAKPQRIDELRSFEPPVRWWIANSTNLPAIAEHVDPITGGVMKLGQLLMFKPWWMHQKHQEMKGAIAQAKDAAGDIKTRNGFKDDKTEWEAGKHMKISSRDEVCQEAEDGSLSFAVESDEGE